MTRRFDVLTLHPEMVRPYLHSSILGRAVKAGHFDVGVHDIRDHATDRHRSVDDTPYGGGAGRVMKIDVVSRAIEQVKQVGTHVVFMSPAGKRFAQEDARRLSDHEHLVFLCGHYEGIDARIEHLIDEELSLGDFVLTGGEIAACAMIDATARLQAGVLGNETSAVDESFSSGLLEYPQFTRPRVWEGHEVPEVLLSGHHRRIEDWRLEQAKSRTRSRRPDLWEAWCEARGVDPSDGSDIDDRRRR